MLKLSKIQPLGFEKNDSSTPKYVPQNTNEHMRLSPLRYVANFFMLKHCLILRVDEKNTSWENTCDGLSLCWQLY